MRHFDLQRQEEGSRVRTASFNWEAESIEATLALLTVRHGLMLVTWLFKRQQRTPVICTVIDAVEGRGQLIQAFGPLHLTFHVIELWLNKKVFWEKI